MKNNEYLFENLVKTYAKKTFNLQIMIKCAIVFIFMNMYTHGDNTDLTKEFENFILFFACDLQLS